MAKQWRDRANEYRQFAARAKSRAAREAYLEIAKSREEMVERIGRFEARLASDTSGAKSVARGPRGQKRSGLLDKRLT